MPLCCGQLASWPTMDRMAAILRDAGLHVIEGRYSLRVQECAHFVFREYDMGKPSIDADADTVEQMIQEGRLVSDALAQAGIRHRFEVYDDHRKMCGYLHHEWPSRVGSLG